jgi:hypothetical protein
LGTASMLWTARLGRSAAARAGVRAAATGGTAPTAVDAAAAAAAMGAVGGGDGGGWYAIGRTYGLSSGPSPPG